MGRLSEAAPAKLFAGVMHRPGFEPQPLLARLVERFGPVDRLGAPYPFESGYYGAEMGTGLVKFFVSFAPLLSQECLAGVKRETNGMEEGGADDSGRVFNLDPGIVTHYSVILATTKGYAHRVYLGGGIYAEPALLFRRGAQEALPWTYPDFQTAAAHDFFAAARRLLLAATKTVGAAPSTRVESRPHARQED